MTVATIIFVSLVGLIIVLLLLVFVVGSIYDRRATRKQKRQNLP